MASNATINFTPIGYVRTSVADDAMPHFYAVSEVEGTLEILPAYQEGMSDIQPGQRINVLFHFDHSKTFTHDQLRQVPRKGNELRGIFSICSPLRPNAIGLSTVTVLAIDGGSLRVKGLDMFDGTPILDIKPVAAPAGRPKG